jgi:hypothetical protein
LSFKLREEHRLRVFENRVPRRIFGPKRDDVMGEWRKLHSEELHILYSSPNIIRQIKSSRMTWVGHVAHMGGDRKLYKVFRWEDGIRMDVRKIGWEVCGVDSLGSG